MNGTALRTGIAPAALCAALLAGLGACGSDAADDGQSVLTVFAASSLSGTFEELGQEFEKSHDGVRVNFNFAGSSDLITQISEGAPADVIATADTATMDKLGDLLGTQPRVFATNTLEIATPPDNPAGIKTVKDLANPEVRLVVCAPEVPCGAAATKVEQTTGLDFTPVSEEVNVADVVGKVTSGEADAGLVYVTDVIGAGDAVQGIKIPPSTNSINHYPVATVAATQNTDAAEKFVEFVLSEDGARILNKAGFGAP